MTIVTVAKTCQSCLMPHSFKKNNTRGVCEYLTKQAGKVVPITRSTYCRFHQTDTRQKAVISQIINTEIVNEVEDDIELE